MGVRLRVVRQCAALSRSGVTRCRGCNTKPAAAQRELLRLQLSSSSQTAAPHRRAFVFSFFLRWQGPSHGLFLRSHFIPIGRMFSACEQRCARSERHMSWRALGTACPQLPTRRQPSPALKPAPGLEKTLLLPREPLHSQAEPPGRMFPLLEDEASSSCPGGVQRTSGGFSAPAHARSMVVQVSVEDASAGLCTGLVLDAGGLRASAGR